MTAVYDLFVHNWSDQVVMETSWLTDVVRSVERLAEERRNLVDSPTRRISVRWTAINRAEAARLMFLLVRAGNQRLRIPIYQDAVLTTGASSGISIPCATAFRRFHAGQLVVIFERSSGRPTNVQWRTIAAGGVADDALTLTTSLTGSFPAGAVVAPALTVEVLTVGALRAITDGVCELAAAFTEVRPSLPESAAWAEISSDFDLDVDGFAYVMDVPLDWGEGVQIGMERPADEHSLTRDSVVVARGPRALLRFDLTFVPRSREEYWRLLRFFDAHRGQAITWWLPGPVTMWSPVAIASGSLDVQAVGDLDDYSSFVHSVDHGSPYLMLELADGTRTMAAVASTSDLGGGVYRMTLDGAHSFAGVALADVRRATLAFLVRFSVDTVRETWLSVRACQVAASAVEVLRWESEDEDAADGFFDGSGDPPLCDLQVGA